MEKDPLAEMTPDDSWEFDRLLDFAATGLPHADHLASEANCLARKSTVMVFRAGKALVLAKGKLSPGVNWGEMLKKKRIPRTNAWEAEELFKKAGSEEAVADLEPTEAKKKFGIYKKKDKSAEGRRKGRLSPDKIITAIQALEWEEIQKLLSEIVRIAAARREEDASRLKEEVKKANHRLEELKKRGSVLDDLVSKGGFMLEQAMSGDVLGNEYRGKSVLPIFRSREIAEQFRSVYEVEGRVVRLGDKRHVRADVLLCVADRKGREFSMFAEEAPGHDGTLTR